MKKKKKRNFTHWREEVNREYKSYKFERLPVLRWGWDTRTRTVEKNGKIVKAEVIIDKKLRNHPKLLEIVVKHELRENLAFQNYASNKQAHRYAKRHEHRDLRKTKLTSKQYRSLTRNVGYVP